MELTDTGLVSPNLWDDIIGTWTLVNNGMNFQFMQDIDIIRTVINILEIKNISIKGSSSEKR
jgi:hypothetical protein